MFSALVDDRNGIHLSKTLHQVPLIECTSLPLLLLHCPTHLKRIWWDGVKQDVWRGKIKAETG